MKGIISSFCAADQPQCVEVAVEAKLGTKASVAVFNSHSTTSGTARFTRKEWDAFVKGVKAGEFDFDRLKALTSA